MDHLLGHIVGPLTIGNKLFKSQFQPPVHRNFPVETEMDVKPKPKNLFWSEEERNENNLIGFALKTRVWNKFTAVKKKIPSILKRRPKMKMKSYFLLPSISSPVMILLITLKKKQQ